MDRIGINAAYMSSTDNLLKHTVAFQRKAKDIIPYTVLGRPTQAHGDQIYFEKEGCIIRAEPLEDLCCVEAEPAMSDQQNTAGMQTGIEQL